ncbi:uncharacterized protein LOC131143847 isoform X2 [Malania oleifera]|uniref:uncharacterized protein LOC131143847 isoform X2 n=1 Tax=Malania oleifera TaxID=397392 RepID=UPI0025ADF55A|nr:uncharacterized protein LOC131143847 isoform X2 [Malania oleifera]
MVSPKYFHSFLPSPQILRMPQLLFPSLLLRAHSRRHAVGCVDLSWRPLSSIYCVRCQTVIAALSTVLLCHGGRAPLIAYFITQTKILCLAEGKVGGFENIFQIFSNGL